MVLAFPSLEAWNPAWHRCPKQIEEGAAVVHPKSWRRGLPSFMMIAWRCLFLSAVVLGQRPPRSGPKARRSKGRRDGARRLEDTSAPTMLTAVPSAVPTSTPTPAPTARPTSEPTFFTWAPTPVPACCVEQQFDATGDVVGTSCYHGRSPWEESTMADLCTAGHSDAGAMAPPFRDCSQAAMDAGSCGGDPAVYDMRAAMRKFKFRGAFTARWR